MGVENWQQGQKTALANRERRSEIKKLIEHGDMMFEELFDKGKYGEGDKVVGHIHIGDAVLALDGIGHVKAAEILAEAGVAEDELINGLNEKQRDAVVAAIEARGYTVRR